MYDEVGCDSDIGESDIDCGMSIYIQSAAPVDDPETTVRGGRRARTRPPSTLHAALEPLHLVGLIPAGPQQQQGYGHSNAHGASTAQSNRAEREVSQQARGLVAPRASGRGGTRAAHRYLASARTRRIIAAIEV